MKRIIYILGFMAAPLMLHAQQPDTAKLKIEYADVVENFERGEATVRQLSGNVRLRQENTVVFSDFAVLTGDDAVLRGKVSMEQNDTLKIFADSALYNAATKVADLYGDVVLINGRQQLFTNRLEYNLATKVATYHQGATLSNGKSQLTSQHGYYYVNEKEVFFKGNVLVTDPEFTLRSDTLSYNTETQLVHFLAPTLISQQNSKVYTEGGFYDIQNNFAEFDKNPQYEREGQLGRARKMRYNGATGEYILEGDAYIIEPERGREVAADVVRYNTETEKAVLVGNARYRDSTQNITGAEIRYDSRNKQYQLTGRGTVSDGSSIIAADSLDFNDELGVGLALGNVVWTDTVNQYTILAHRLDYNKQSEYLHAFGSSGAEGPAGRPLMKSVVEGDTLYLSADTLTSFRPDTTAEARVLLAYPEVRIFKSDLQGSADSMAYDGRDSVFYFYKKTNLPLLWSDTSQFSADTIRMQMRNRQIDRIWLDQNALIVTSPDEIYFNQIQGRNSVALFDSNEVRQLHVTGNAEALYYGLDEKNAYIGVNETQCSEMKLFFDDNQVTGIRFYNEPEGTFTPMKQAGKNPRTLSRFFWEKMRRPRSVADLLSKKMGI